MYCPNCGTKYSGNFCPNCGYGVKRKKKSGTLFGVVLIILAFSILGGVYTMNQMIEQKDYTASNNQNIEPSIELEVTENKENNTSGEVLTGSEVHDFINSMTGANSSKNNKATDNPNSTGSNNTNKNTNKSSGNIEYDNALERAKSYISHEGYSYSRLIEQLEFEGFSGDACAYAALNCGADWNEQAAKRAKSYLSHQNYSYSRLIEQLEFEGFTQAQAIYGANQNGYYDNNSQGNSENIEYENALKSAKSYIKHQSFSYSRLIEQLEYEGFTHEQAVYGANQNGYYESTSSNKNTDKASDWEYIAQGADAVVIYMKSSGYSDDEILRFCIEQGFSDSDINDIRESIDKYNNGELRHFE